eukprot:6352975-Amphidinium_carterae.1
MTLENIALMVSMAPFPLAVVHSERRSLLASSMLYGVVQFPAFLLELTMGLPGADDGKLDRLVSRIYAVSLLLAIRSQTWQAELEGPFALAGALAGAVAFVLYVRDMAVSLLLQFGRNLTRYIPFVERSVVVATWQRELPSSVNSASSKVCEHSSVHLVLRSSHSSA